VKLLLHARVFLVALLLVSCAGPEANYLLTTSAGIEAAREKADRQPWARATLDGILERADEALRQPVELPDRGGQWPHWYSCPKDGADLETLSPTRHRCPLCGEIYSGDPYDAVVLYRSHRRYSNDVRDLGLAYRFTGKSDYAKRAVEILRAYADRYQTYPLHNIHGEAKVGGARVMAQTLDEAVWLIPVAFGYSLVRDQIPEQDRRHIEDDLFVAAADVIRAHRMGIHNIQCWKNSAVGLAGFVTGRDDLVAEAIDDPDRGFRVQIERGVTADGLWFEGSLGYHRYTLDALWPLAEAARLRGIDLYSERYRKMFDAPLLLAFPNGDAPGFNDNAGDNVYSSARLYELAFARWGTPAYGSLLRHTGRDSIEALLYGAETLPDAEVIPRTSVLMPAAGYAALRSPDLTAVIRYGMHGGGHGHPDKLDLVTYGNGRSGGLDPGSIHYGVPLHRAWYRTTIAHNTVAVDMAQQRPVDGKLLDWSAGAGDTVFRGSAGEVYPGVQLVRELRLSGDRLRDRFELSSEKVHTYDWAFHAPGTLKTDLPVKPATGTIGSGNGYQHLALTYRANTDIDWTATWTWEGKRMELHMKGAPGTVVFLGAGPGRDPADKISCVVVRRRTRATVFDAGHRFPK